MSAGDAVQGFLDPLSSGDAATMVPVFTEDTQALSACGPWLQRG